MRPDLVVPDSSRLHPTEPQRIYYQNVDISDKGVRLYPVELRLVPPAEMDLMAQLAGLQLKERWGGWQREPLTNSTQKHISIYEKPHR